MFPSLLLFYSYFFLSLYYSFLPLTSLPNSFEVAQGQDPKVWNGVKNLLIGVTAWSQRAAADAVVAATAAAVGEVVSAQNWFSKFISNQFPRSNQMLASTIVHRPGEMAALGG